MNINATTLFATAGLAAALATPAFAQSHYSYDDDQDQNQRERMQDRERDTMRPKRTAEDEQRYWDHYFGKEAKGASAAMGKLHPLTGPFTMKAVFYGDHGERADRPIETTGFAERRAAFDGSMIIERYTFKGGPDALPLTHDSPLARQMAYSRSWEKGDTAGQPDRDDATSPQRRDRERLTRDEGQSPDRARASYDKGPRKGVVLWGYDPGADEYTVAWSGSNSPAVRYDKGEINDQNQLVMTGEYTDAETDETYQTRTVLEIMSPDRQKLTMFVDGGMFETEKKVYEISYQRDEDFEGFSTVTARDRREMDRNSNERDRERSPRRNDWDRD